MRARGSSDSGATLVEVIVAIGLFAFLSTALTSVLASTSKAARAGQEVSSMNEEARLALERIARELRQARSIDEATLPAANGQGETSMQMWIDFGDGVGGGPNGVRDDTAADPEVLTYRYDPATEQLTLTATDQTGATVTRPVLAANVSRFSLGFVSSLYQYDANADGVTDWTEIDAAPGAGNGNGVLDAPELDKIDSVKVEITIFEGSKQQTYRTQVGLRNKSQS